MNRPPLLVPFLVSVCFFVSGAAGLIYQTVWARYLGLFLGHSSYAVVAVLVAFMGGLAIGNAWLGGLADRTRRPLALYGWLELGIGLYAVVFPIYYSFCHDAFIQLAGKLGPGNSLLLWAKFAFSLATILIPTALMGATFPALTRFVTQTLEELRGRIALLYCLNSAGAIAGCCLGDFWLIPTYGLPVSVFVAAGLNFAAGILTLALSFQVVKEDSRMQQTEDLPADETFTRAELKLAVLAAGISGFAAMLYEVAWTRLLSLVLGSSTHAFSLMLITFIAGITFGAWIVARWKTVNSVITAFGWAELALGLGIAFAMPFYEHLPFLFMKLATIIEPSDRNYAVLVIVQLGVCFLVMFPPAVCLGLTLPLAGRIATARLSESGRSVGTVFAVNTLGTVLGAVLTGLLLLPGLGLAATFGLGIGLNLWLGFALLRRKTWPLNLRTFLLGIAGTTALAMLAGVMFDKTWRRSLSMGIWRTPVEELSLSNFQNWRDAPELVYHKDGAQATVSVRALPEAGSTNLILQVNGKTDASNGRDMVTQSMIGHIPLILRPTAKNVLIVGLGSGVTAGSVSLHPGLEQVDVVEISPEVREAAVFFSAHNHNVLQNSKVHITVEDAKTFLLASVKNYDVIISEPSNPWMAGVAAVFSRDFYVSCRNRLSRGGLMVQWVQTYESSDAAFDTVLRTFASVFPNVGIWAGIQENQTADIILVGSVEPAQVDMEALSQRFHEPRVLSDLQGLGITRLPLFLAHEISPQENGAFIPPDSAPLHTDLRPVLEYVSQRARFVQKSADGLLNHDERFQYRSGLLLRKHLDSHPAGPEDYQPIADYFHLPLQPQTRLVRSLGLSWQRNEPGADGPLEMLNAIRDAPTTAELRSLRFSPDFDRMVLMATRNPEPLRNHVGSLIAVYRLQRSVFYLPPADELRSAVLSLMPLDSQSRRSGWLILAELAWDNGMDDECLRFGRLALDAKTKAAHPMNFYLNPAGPATVLAHMLDIHSRRGELAEALKLYDASAPALEESMGDPARVRLELAHRKLLHRAGQLRSTP